MMDDVKVLGSDGRELSPCSPERADALLTTGRAAKVSDSPLTIQLDYAVEVSSKPQPDELPGKNKHLLLHICCAPCSTYTVGRLRDEAYMVTGFWYNPNIHPYQEYDLRRACLETYARTVELPMRWAEYDIPAFLRAVAGNESLGQRCRVCYRMRLERTARQAKSGDYDAFTTTLLISPFQDQEAIREIGEEVAEAADVDFHFENFRRGWSDRGRLTKENGLYRQQYCGCIYSEWERYRGNDMDELGG
jgi:predicted adenine nucleotide alpha hydrolase (AANH) superfamily ATPase